MYAPARPRLITQLGKLPRIGFRVLKDYDAWTAFKLERWYWEAKNRKAVEAFTRQDVVLTSPQQRVVDDLSRSGIAQVHYDELFQRGPDWSSLKQLVDRWLEDEDVQRAVGAYQSSGHKQQVWKEYLIKMHEPGVTLPWDDAFLRLALRPEITDVTNSYLGMVAKLLEVNIWNTIPLEHGGEDSGSQRWHRDPEDRRLVKVFLYFTDVDETAGPLEYVPNSRRGERYGHLWPQKPPRGSVVDRTEMDRSIPPTARLSCTHPAGTLLFVDTSGLHRGGRATKKHRVLGLFVYTTHATMYPRRFALIDRPPAELRATTEFSLA